MNLIRLHLTVELLFWLAHFPPPRLIQILLPPTREIENAPKSIIHRNVPGGGPSVTLPSARRLNNANEAPNLAVTHQWIDRHRWCVNPCSFPKNRQSPTGGTYGTCWTVAGFAGKIQLLSFLLRKLLTELPTWIKEDVQPPSGQLLSTRVYRETKTDSTTSSVFVELEETIGLHQSITGNFSLLLCCCYSPSVTFWSPKNKTKNGRNAPVHFHAASSAFCFYSVHTRRYVEVCTAK